FHKPPNLKKQAEEFMIPVPEYDRIADLWVKDVKTWKEIATDSNFVKVVASDEQHFVKAPIHIMLRYDNAVNGEKVPR
ncbi:hypothetical protein K469DRAFT_564203, partial [Zopfia rhizophila CBS 207.26]